CASSSRRVSTRAPGYGVAATSSRRSRLSPTDYESARMRTICRSHATAIIAPGRASALMEIDDEATPLPEPPLGPARARRVHPHVAARGADPDPAPDLPAARLHLSTV